VFLYLSNSACQSAVFNGGNVPVMGFHSVMDKPDSVSLVMPPSKTWIIIIATPINSHIAIGFEDLSNGWGMRKVISIRLLKIYVDNYLPGIFLQQLFLIKFPVATSFFS
jgi:hypothetical protein